MTGELPAWQPFDPSGSLPSSVAPPSTDPSGRVLALVAAPGAREDGWAERTAVDLARKWAGAGVRTLLLDLSFERPALHRLLDRANDEGVTDAFLYGASMGRIARPVGEGPLVFAPAGSPTADPAEVMAHPRWDALLEGFREAGASLLLYTPAGAPGLRSLLDRVPDSVILGLPGETPDAVAPGLGARAWLGPPDRADQEVAARARRGAIPTAAPGPAAPAEAGEKGPEASAGTPDPFWEADAQPVAATGAAATGEASPAAADRPGDREATPPARAEAPAPAGARPERRARRERSPWLVASLGALVVAAGVVAAGLAGLVPLPGAEAGDTDAAPADVGTLEPVAVTPPGPAMDPQGWSLALGIYTEGQAARHLGRLQARYPDRVFVNAPVDWTRGMAYWVLAGPAGDSASAAALQPELAAAFPNMNPGMWEVRSTPLAYELGEYARLGEAEGRAASLREAGVPAYVLEVPFTNETNRYRVYAGAYESPEEAAAMGRLLSERPEASDAPLVERTGRAPE